MKNLKKIIYQSNQSIYINKQLNLTVTLVTIFRNPAGEANPYVQFGCIPQTICNSTQGQFSLSMNADQINANKKVNNK